MSLYIGLMSGTSADAVDAVLADFDHGALQEVVAASSLSIPNAIRDSILKLYEPAENEIERMGQLDVELGQLFAQAARNVLNANGFEAHHISAIGCHGQTVRHRPRSSTPFTLQIGDPSTIVRHTGITTVADLRRADMAWGGQGAPLAPAFHHACFSHPSRRRGVLNIGGIANLTVLDGATLKCGYDLGPGNSLMDYWIDKHKSKRWDTEGHWAQSGHIDRPLLDRLRTHEFFKLPPPKSTGREEFSGSWLEDALPSDREITAADVQATLLELTALSISQEVQNWTLDELFVCGGGAHNTALMQRLQALNSTITIQTTEALGVPVGQVEALTFAWLAHQTLRKAAGNSPAVTGAQKSVILGGVYWA